MLNILYNQQVYKMSKIQSQIYNKTHKLTRQTCTRHNHSLSRRVHDTITHLPDGYTTQSLTCQTGTRPTITHSPDVYTTQTLTRQTCTRHNHSLARRVHDTITHSHVYTTQSLTRQTCTRHRHALARRVHDTITHSHVYTT